MKEAQEFKSKLTSTPVLVLLEGTKDYAMYCDALGVGLGCVLIHHGKVIVMAQRSCGHMRKMIQPMI